MVRRCPVVVAESLHSQAGTRDFRKKPSSSIEHLPLIRMCSPHICGVTMVRASKRHLALDQQTTRGEAPKHEGLIPQAPQHCRTATRHIGKCEIALLLVRKPRDCECIMHGPRKTSYGSTGRRPAYSGFSSRTFLWSRPLVGDVSTHKAYQVRDQKSDVQRS